MANSSKIGNGLYQVKLRLNGESSCSCTIPRELAAEAGMLPGAGFIAVQRVGKVIVLSLSQYAIPEDARLEADRNIDRAFAEWQAKRARRAEQSPPL